MDYKEKLIKITMGLNIQRRTKEIDEPRKNKNIIGH
jgi:hypothetical protein